MGRRAHSAGPPAQSAANFRAQPAPNCVTESALKFSVRVGALNLAVLLLLGGVVCPAYGQAVQNVLHARRRVFPDVGRGAAEIERDAAGRYFVLAYPASVIWIYGANGQRIGQIPDAQSTTSEIKYAVDFDLDAEGRVFVADRGANAIKIFTPRGVLEASVMVNAPMSVVALTGGEFAVVTLRSEHLVRIFNERGKLIRDFGNIADAVSDTRQINSVASSSAANPSTIPDGYTAGYSSNPPANFAMDIGKIYPGAAGEIYFAFTSVQDPKFRKYDSFGYSGYEALIPARSLIPDLARDNSRVQLGMRVSGMAGQGKAFTFGTMYSVGGSAGFTANGGGGGGRRGGGRGGSGGAGNSNGSGAGAETDSGSNSTAISGTEDASGMGGALAMNANSDATNFSNLSDANALIDTSGMGGMFGTPGLSYPGPGGFGGPFGFGGGGFGGPMGGFGEHRFEGDVAGGAGAAGISGTHLGAAPGTGGGTGGTPGAGHGEFGDRGFHGFDRGVGLHAVSGVVRFTVGEPDTKTKPVIQALGVDTANRHVWATVNDMLLNLDQEGNVLDIYRIATPEGAALQPVGILVEPNRLLLVADPAGIYEFARPDKQPPPGARPTNPQSPSASSTASTSISSTSPTSSSQPQSNARPSATPVRPQ